MNGTVKIHPSGSRPEDLRRWERADGKTWILLGTYEKRGQSSVGRLEVLDPEKSDAFTPLPLLQRDGKLYVDHFTPHGLCVVKNSEAPGWEGKDLCYAVHVNGGSKHGRTVEVFELTPSSAVHLGTLGQSNMPQIEQSNGIAARRDGVVFVSNFKRDFLAKSAPMGIGRILGKGESVPPDSVVRFEPAKKAAEGNWVLEAEKIGGANGLACDEKNGHLIVAGFYAKRVFYVPLLASGAGDWSKAVTVLGEKYGFPDNLAPTGSDSWRVCASLSRYETTLRFLVGDCFPGWSSSNHSVEFRLDGSRPVASLIPRQATLPSVTVPINDRIYVGRVQRGGVVSWIPGR
jgi:hypothetical protein